MSFQTYEEVRDSTDAFDLLEHCKQCVIENNEQNGGKFSDWDGGAHVVEVYIEHNAFIKDDPDAHSFIVKALDDWLSSNIY